MQKKIPKFFSTIHTNNNNLEGQQNNQYTLLVTLDRHDANTLLNWSNFLLFWIETSKIQNANNNT